MNDDDDALLDELGRLSREETTEAETWLDGRWERLSAGEVAPAEEAELRALAAGSAAAGAAFEAFRPLGPDFKSRLVQALQPPGQPAAAPPAAGEPPAAETAAARLLPFRRPTARLAGWLAAVAALAAVLVLTLRPAPFPLYEMVEVGGGVRETREVGLAQAFAPGDFVRLTLQPPTPVKGEVTARGFLARDMALEPWPVHAVTSPVGAVRIEGYLPKGQGVASSWTLWLVVGRPGKLPGAAELRERLTPGPLASGPVRARDWIALRKTLRFRCEPSSQSC